MEDILNISTLSISEKPDTETDAVDRLSSLPEHLISDILSKLPTDSAVATSILSRHWRHQWTYITRFQLSPHNITNCDELHAFLTTVDNILRQLNSPPSNLRTFFLNFNLPYPDEPFEDEDEDEDDIGYELCCEFLPRWFHQLCSSHTQRLQVFEFGAYLSVYIQNAPLVFICSPEIESSSVVDVADTLSLPKCIFENKTLVELMLATNLSLKKPNYLNLPNLKTLSVNIFEHDRQLMRTFFKSLPLLQELTISAHLRGHDHFIDILAPSLKIFTIKFDGQGSQTTVLIDAPKLKCIKISIRGGLVLFRFVKIPIHLLKTSLSLRESVGDDLAILELLKAITVTRSLRVCCRILNVLNSYNVDELPTFHNLVSLTLELSDGENMNLAIPVWILRRLKKIQVEGVSKGNEYDKEISLMEDILSKANVLERLICVFNPNVEEPKMDSLQKQNDFVNALFMLPRVCSSCEIKFLGNFVRVSTNEAESRSVSVSDLLDYSSC